MQNKYKKREKIDKEIKRRKIEIKKNKRTMVKIQYVGKIQYAAI